MYISFSIIGSSGLGEYKAPPNAKLIAVECYYVAKPKLAFMLVFAKETNGASPVSSTERIDLIDALRGFALFGVAIANTVAMSGFNPYLNPNLLNNATDKAAREVLSIFIDGKFYTIFAFLFGLGFGLQLFRAQQRSTPFVSIYLKRIGVLLLIGLCNYILFLSGDILRTYALIALLLLLFRNVSDRSLWIAAIASLLFPYLFRAVLDFIEFKRPAGTDPKTIQQTWQAGDYLKAVGIQVYELKRYWWNIFVITGPTTLTLFLLGYYAARKRYFVSLRQYLPRIKMIFWIALVVGVIGTIGSPHMEKLASDLPVSVGRGVSGLFNTVITLSKAIFYIACLILVWESRLGKRILKPLCAVGRMALTNYLAVYLICLLLFFGTSYYGNFRLSWAIMLGVTIWAIELAWSNLWFTRFQFGPVEWVWRLLTFGYSPKKNLKSELSGS